MGAAASVDFSDVEAALAGGKTQEEIDAYIAANALPAAVVKFFDGEPMAGKAEELMGTHFDDSMTLAFVGDFAPPPLKEPKPKAMAGEIIGGLVKSFPDFTFNSGKAPVYKAEDGSYYADIVVSGTHTGEAYAPMPGLTPVEKTDKKVDIGPEKFSLFLSEEGKVVKITIEPKEGKPAGPPGFYTEIGGVLPGPGAATVGSPTFHMVFKVPKADEAEMDAYWKEHEEWMNKAHTVGPEGDDSVAPRLFEFYICKGEELIDPMKPESEKTGNIIYEMSEAYYAPEAIGKHLELCGKDMAEWMGKLPGYVEKYATHVDAGTTSVLTAFSDDGAVFKTSKGKPTLHVYWKVPEADVETVDAFWKEHEAWMKSAHVMGADAAADDSATPRLLSFYISKGAELLEPMNPASEKTGNFIYVMSECYVDPAGIAKHFELCGASMPEWFAKFQELTGKYLVHMDVGTCSVFTTMAAFE
jgi:hypothetical protein